MTEASEGPRVETTGSSIVGRVKEAVDSFVHKHLTLEGREETIRAERHYDEILSKMSPEERLRAEPVFAEQARKAAVGTVVRDVGVTAAVLGGAAVGYKYRKEIGGVTEKVAKGAWSKLPEGVQKAGARTAGRVQVAASRTRETVAKPINAAAMRVGQSTEPLRSAIKGKADKLTGFLGGMRDAAVLRARVLFRRPSPTT